MPFQFHRSNLIFTLSHTPTNFDPKAIWNRHINDTQTCKWLSNAVYFFIPIDSVLCYFLSSYLISSNIVWLKWQNQFSFQVYFCSYGCMVIFFNEASIHVWTVKEITSNLNQISSSKFIWLKWYSFMTPSPSWSFSIMVSLLLTLSSCSQEFTWVNNVERISEDPTSNCRKTICCKSDRQ